jgi:hypothetical protein
MTTPTDLDGKPYTPILNYGWMTDAHRATCALHMACDPAQIEYRLDARYRRWKQMKSRGASTKIRMAKAGRGIEP